MAQLQATNVAGTLTALRTENEKTSNHTLELIDRDRVVAMNSASNLTVTVPNDSSVNFPAGSVVYIVRLGSGSVTLAAAGGVTLSKTGTFGPGEELYVRKRAANNWIVVDSPVDPPVTGGTESEENGIGVNFFTGTGANNLTIG